MIEAAGQAQSTEQNPLLGIALKVGSVCAFLGMATFIKLSGQPPAGQISFYRSFWAMVPIIVYLLARGQFTGVFKTDHLMSHFLRGGVGVLAMSLGFYGLTRLPLPDAVALGYARPLITVVLGALILGEVVRRYRWGSVFIGFIGVMIIAWPKLEVLRGAGGLQNEQAIGVLATLGHVFVASFAFILVRKLVQTERTATIVLYFSLTASFFALLTLPLGWDELGWHQIGFLIVSGFCGGLGQIMLTESYRYAETSTIAPFEYTSVLLSLAVGFWLFSDIPTWSTIIGSAIVVASGIFIIYRERALGLKRAAERKATNVKGL